MYLVSYAMWTLKQMKVNEYYGNTCITVVMCMEFHQFLPEDSNKYS